MRELVYTGRDFNRVEATVIPTNLGLTNQFFSNRETMLTSVFAVAASIASKSPLCVRGNKQVILYSREDSIADGLDYIAIWNAGMLISDDIEITLKAQEAGKTPHFKN